MSDQPQGPDWRQGPDGSWHPPEPTRGFPPPHAGNSPRSDVKGFFGSLYDFSFDSFVTPKLIRVFYAIAVLVLTAFAVVFLVAGLASGEGGGIAAALILVPLGYLVYLVLTRIYFELVAALFRIADDLRAIRRGQGL